MSQHQAPKSAIVIGAGMVGLSTAWHLNQAGVEVTVIDRAGVSAGASRGNAGWLTPGITTPLPEPAVLKYGVKAVLSPSSPVYVPLRLDSEFIRFVTGFTMHSNARAWKKAMATYIPLNNQIFDSFDELADVVKEPVTATENFLSAYLRESDAKGMLDEFKAINAAGQEVEFEGLSGKAAREINPFLSDNVEFAIRLGKTRYINPHRYMQDFGRAVEAAGVKLALGQTVIGIADRGSRVAVKTDQAQVHEADTVVIATGTWLGSLARQFGVKQVVHAGRGYSFNVAVEEDVPSPIYMPIERVACTPLGNKRFQIAGMMEFRAPNAPLDQRRIKAIVEAARPMLKGVDLDDRQAEWVGSRPCTPDGVPLVGRTTSDRVYVAGGHGMWGITLGPLTGRLLAQQMISGVTPAELQPLDPLR